jgi:hypothetical protein
LIKKTTPLLSLEATLLYLSRREFTPLIYSLYDVSSTITAISATGFTATLKDEYGLAVQGLAIGDFALYNTTDSTMLIIDAMTETSAGVYEFTFTSQTSADVLRLTPTENGYDFSLVVDNLITI